MEDNSDTSAISCTKDALAKISNRSQTLLTAAIVNLQTDVRTKTFEEWDNFYGSNILLGEVYVAASNLKHLLSTLENESEIVINDDDEECLLVTTQSLVMINACMNTLDLCQQELYNSHNISLEMH